MTWKITQTKDPRWLAVLSDHYDEPFAEDMNTIPGAYFNERMVAWLAPAGRWAELEAVCTKHSPPPMVELLAGAEGVAQLLDHATRIGAPDDADSLVVQGLELALEDLVDMDTLETRTVRVARLRGCGGSRRGNKLRPNRLRSLWLRQAPHRSCSSTVPDQCGSP